MAFWSHLRDKITSLMTEHKGLPDTFKHTSLSACNWLAVDFEYSSLDVATAKFMSAGWIEGNHTGIDIQSSYYRLIRAQGDLAQTPIIHGLTPSDIARGVHVRDMYEHICQFATSHIWVLHNAQLDMGMLKELSKRLQQPLPAIVCIDTMQLALYQLYKKVDVIPKGGVILSKCRERYELANAPAHNALSDAMATLELWMAQMHSLDPSGCMTLNELKNTGAIKVFARHNESEHELV